MTWLLIVLVAALAGFGAAIALVEKKSQWPATAVRPIISKLLRFVYHKLPEMLDCSVCTSFWTSFLASLYISLCNNMAYWYYAPLSGFVGIAVTWTVIETMNAIDPK